MAASERGMLRVALWRSYVSSILGRVGCHQLSIRGSGVWCERVGHPPRLDAGAHRRGTPRQFRGAGLHRRGILNDAIAARLLHHLGGSPQRDWRAPAAVASLKLGAPDRAAGGAAI